MQYLWFIYNNFTNEVADSFISEAFANEVFLKRYAHRDSFGENIFSLRCIDVHFAVKNLLDSLDHLSIDLTNDER